MSIWQHALVVGYGGIGTALCQTLVERGVPAVTVFTRSPARVPAGAGIEALQADVTDPASLETAASRLIDRPPVDLLIYATGVLQDDSCAPEKALANVSAAALAHSFAVNATGFAITLAALRDRLQLRAPLHVVALSARVGSIADNRAGGWYGYRASKSALNMLVRTASLELGRRNRKAVCLALHPGTVDTRLSAPHVRSGYRHRLFEPGEAAARLLDVIAAADHSANGTFLAWDGERVPW